MGTIVDQDPLKGADSVAASSNATAAETPIITASYTTTVEKLDSAHEDVGTIMDMSDVRFTPREDLNDFYVKFRRRVCNHLRKTGFVSEDDPNDMLVLSPMCEELIVVWCLEKIDPAVPKQVRETFGPQLVGNVSVKDLQEEIFKVIPVFLNLNSKEGFEDDSFFASNKTSNPAELLKQEYSDDDHHMDLVDDFQVSRFTPLNAAKTRQQRPRPTEDDFIDDGSHKCKICGKVFKSEKHLGWHQRYHKVDEIPSTCKICGKEFESKYKLNYHKQVHKIEISECYACGKTFKTRKNMKDHIYKHHRYDIQCAECDEVLPNYSEYGVHLQKIHQQNVTLFIRGEPGVHRKKKVAHSEDEEPEESSEESESDGSDAEGEIVTEESKSDAEVTVTVGGEVEKDGIPDEWKGGELTSVDGGHEETIDPNGEFKPPPPPTVVHPTITTVITRPYKCQVPNCNRQFLKEKHLHKHQKTHKGRAGKFSCPTCGKELDNRVALVTHKRTHKVQVSECDICGKTYNKRKSLSDHIYKHHRSNIECKKCSMVFPDNNEYNKHMQEHIRAEPKREFSCEICGKVLKSLASLKLHVANHERNMSCTICNVKFEYKNLYNRHMATVHQVVGPEKKLPCDMCGKLVTQQRLKGHMKTHLTKYKCGTCSRAFTSEKELGSHICKHYTCDICDRKFVYQRNLEFHKREHAGEVMFQCDMCEALFLKKNRLAEHKRFLHFKVRRYKCEICNKDFAVKNGLDNHMRSHTGERPFKCDDCGQTFALNSSLYTHKKLHNNELPHECDGCHKRFRNSGNLKTHRERKLCGVTDNDLFRNNVEN